MLLQGSVFFPLPDGQGLMYYVSGTAEAPKPNGKVSRDVPCKTTFTESLAVQNWLKKSQRSLVCLTRSTSLCYCVGWLVGWLVVGSCEKSTEFSHRVTFTVYILYYPHMPIGKVWMYRLLFVYLFLRLRICPPRHGGLSTSKAGNLPFLWTLLPRNPKSDELASARAPHGYITVEMRRRKRHARDAPFVT